MKSFLVIIILLHGFCFSNAQPKFEFRAAWIATVDNIDWPSKGNYYPDSQRAEFIRLLDMHQRNGMNAVIVQVRPATDAFYPSPLEPWSEWLTGRQGRPPSPYYDPLQFMIEETHKRGMEFHAWCNPYRAEFNIGRSSISPAHLTRIRPEWFLVYGGQRFFDPGNKDAQQHVAGVIRDLVKRYDVDAIHFDDYFYPYRIPGRVFPDDASFERFGNGLARDDWRRSNVDSITVLLGRAIKQENRYCKFGISPFGVWRNDDKDPEGSATKGGMSNYDDLYADIVLWAKNGWIDYVTPQLYWELGHRLVAFETLIEWWSRHAYGRHLYIGHGIYKAYERGNTPWRKPAQLPDQITRVRTYPTVQGSVYYNSSSFPKNPNGWNDSLQNNYYRHPAIIPPMPWIDSTRPQKPVIQKQENGWKITVPANVRYIALYAFHAPRDTVSEQQAMLKLIPPVNGEAFFDTPELIPPGEQRFMVTSVSRNNVESEAVVLE